MHPIVLVSRLPKPALRALALARATRPDRISAITLNVDPDDTRHLRADWEKRALPVSLTVLEAPYRDLVRPLVTYVKLHNQSALRFKARLLFTPGVVVVDVPYQLGVDEQGRLGNRRPPHQHPTLHRQWHRPEAQHGRVGGDPHGSRDDPGC